MQEGFQASAYTFNMPLKKQLRRKGNYGQCGAIGHILLDQLGLGLRRLPLPPNTQGLKIWKLFLFHIQGL